MRRVPPALVLVGVLAALAACGGSGGASSTGTPASASLAAPAATAAASTGSASGLNVTDAWAHAAAKGQISAAYFTLANATSSADALVSATSPAAGTTEIHQTTVDAAGVAAMKPAGRIELAAGDSVVFEPGGYHVMLIDLTSDLTIGSTVRLDLVFEKAGPVVVEAEVRRG